LKLVNLELIKEALTELDPTLEDAEDGSYKTALVLVSALAYGPDSKVLADFTDVPREFVEAIRQRMIQAELWTEIDVHCGHWFGGGKIIFPVAFTCDVLTALGKVRRRWNEDKGNYQYSVAE
jgi:hypothetical protein